MSTELVCSNCGKPLGSAGAPHAHGPATALNANGKTVYAPSVANVCPLCQTVHRHVTGMAWLCVLYQAQRHAQANGLQPITQDQVGWATVAHFLTIGAISFPVPQKRGRRPKLSTPVASSPQPGAQLLGQPVAECGVSLCKHPPFNGTAYCRWHASYVASGAPNGTAPTMPPNGTVVQPQTVTLTVEEIGEPSPENAPEPIAPPVAEPPKIDIRELLKAARKR